MLVFRIGVFVISARYLKSISNLNRLQESYIINYSKWEFTMELNAGALKYKSNLVCMLISFSNSYLTHFNIRFLLLFFISTSSWYLFIVDCHVSIVLYKRRACVCLCVLDVLLMRCHCIFLLLYRNMIHNFGKQQHTIIVSNSIWTKFIYMAINWYITILCLFTFRNRA